MGIMRYEDFGEIVFNVSEAASFSRNRHRQPHRFHAAVPTAPSANPSCRKETKLQPETKPVV